ncbi:MAG: class I SAM-dependent methyltransferase [Gammaproteobacteria bacterium]|nr:class I SAM-dependent methyltransferase [Gammaproteobacteria bacterium]
MTKMDNNPAIEITSPQKVNNMLYWLAGALILPINKIRHVMEGYTTPRTFGMSEYDRAVDYDFSVVKSWQLYLDYYLGKTTSLEGRSILELGPGADLGIGLILTAKGAKRYNSLDVNNLVKSVPNEFYDTLFDRISTTIDTPSMPIEELKSQLEATKNGNNDKINYICDESFNFNHFDKEGIDLVFSQAAFEHFDNIPETFSQLTKIVQPDAVLIAEIDLSTHTRWIRDRDPNNIYRYPEWFYNVCKFRGSPNRLRPNEYKTILEDLGWNNVKIIPRICLSSEYVEQSESGLTKKFSNKESHMEQLSVILCATR